MAFNVLNDFEKVERIIKENQDNNEINISDYSFISPSTLLPLIHYIEENNISNIYSSDEKIQEYIYSVLGKKEQCDNIIHIQRLKNHNHKFNIERYLDDTTDKIFNMLQLDINLNGFYLILYELLLNIYNHSKFNNAYVLCQRYPNDGTADICIIDNGISIPGSFEESEIDFINDAEAIFNAINGTSSNKEKSGLKGRGLNTIVRFVSLGFKEEILIVSRNGLCSINQKGAILKKLDNDIIKGTFISLRLNNEKFNETSYELTKIERL